MAAPDLVAALVSDRHRVRYHTSPSFRSAVDTLAAMLPSWLDGLAEQSAETDRKMALAVEALRNAPGSTPLSDSIERTDP